MECNINAGNPEALLPVFSAPIYGGKVLRELLVSGRNVIRPWGVEFADSSAFYSMEDGFGYRYELIEHQESTGPFSHETIQVIRMREGLVRLELVESLNGPREFRRTCTLTCLEDTTLMDFVLRYRFLASGFSHGYIAGYVLPFIKSNIYHQYPINTSAVGNDKYSIRVKVVRQILPSCMKGYMYLRDSDDAWVLHIRMLPKTWNKEVIKLCSRWFGTRPLPQWLGELLLHIPHLKKTLWYRGEQRPWQNWIARIFSPNAYPMARIAKREVLQWDAICQIESSALPSDD